MLGGTIGSGVHTRSCVKWAGGTSDKGIMINRNRRWGTIVDFHCLDLSFFFFSTLESRSFSFHLVVHRGQLRRSVDLLLPSSSNNGHRSEGYKIAVVVRNMNMRGWAV
jgi:hypothetical protein